MAKLFFIGAGRMARAMVTGIIGRNLFPPQEIICTGARDGTAETLADDTGIGYTYNVEEAIRGADLVVLACKPQQLKELDPRVGDDADGKLFVSILAGTPICRLAALFGKASNIVRCMPNTPGQIGAGVTAYASRDPLSPEDRVNVEGILSALGAVVATDEVQLDAVTAVSGSGPAYVFEFIAALRDGGVAAGLDEAMAYQLALKTVTGAAQLLEKVPESPETHRDWVSSPGGTTLAGLAIMESSGFRDVMKKTVLAARDRSLELAKDS